MMCEEARGNLTMQYTRFGIDFGAHKCANNTFVCCAMSGGQISALIGRWVTFRCTGLLRWAVFQIWACQLNPLVLCCIQGTPGTGYKIQEALFNVGYMIIW